MSCSARSTRAASIAWSMVPSAKARSRSPSASWSGSAHIDPATETWVSEASRRNGTVSTVASEQKSARPEWATAITGTRASIASATGSPKPSPRAGWT